MEEEIEMKTCCCIKLRFLILNFKKRFYLNKKAGDRYQSSKLLHYFNKPIMSSWRIYKQYIFALTAKECIEQYSFSLLVSQCNYVSTF